MLKKDLAKMAHINSSTMAKLGKGLPVSMEILARICLSLNCNVGDIVDFVGQGKENA
jgi:DNA-binding Xre family transcriptional regulator